MQLNPYLHFDGRCAEAFDFYAGTLGGDIEYTQIFGDSPACDQVPPEWRDKIMHTSLAVGNQILMGCDPPPGSFHAPAGMAVALAVETPDEVERIFAALAEGGTVIMPVAETFWAQRFGMVTDRFGIPRILNCLKPEY